MQLGIQTGLDQLLHRTEQFQRFHYGEYKLPNIFHTSNLVYAHVIHHLHYIHVYHY